MRVSVNHSTDSNSAVDKKLLQQPVRGVNDAPADESPCIVDVHAVEHFVPSTSFSANFKPHLRQRLKRATQLGLNVRLDHVDWVEEG